MSVLVLSVCALTAFVSAANNWPLQGTNDFRNLLLQGTRPVRQSGPFTQSPVAYNNANGFANVPYNPQQNQLNNLPVNNIQWLPFLPPNNAYPFLPPQVKNQNAPDFQRALNNFVNVQTNNLQKKPYSQGGYIQTPGAIVEQKPATTNQGFPINQVQYIAYTTPQSVNQLNRNTGNPQQPIQVASFNMKQGYPQNNPNVIPQFIDLDFNAKNPFNSNQNKNRANVPVQPVINFDINFNTPFPQNHPVAPNPNQQYTHSILTPPKPSTKVVPHLPSLPGIEFDSNNPFVGKNHKDDITHEPVHQPPDTFYDTEETPPVERLEHEKAPVTVHDEPPEVPKRPIYPGQGKWAKFGLRKKHKPHVSPHPNNYAILPETLGIPEGYDTFIEGQDLFDFQNDQFGKKLQEFPNKHQLGPALPEDDESTTEEEQQQYQNNDDGGSQENEDEFVPSRLYAQVRHTEDEKHLPPAADENGRLKELLKDSKVHTIYSEEGYEDLAYDHAGHEKKAENAEGYEKDKKEVVNDKAKTNIPIKEVKDIQKEKETYVDKEKINKDEFEKLKEEALRFDEEEDDDDSETEATEYDKSIITKVRPPKKVYSAKTKDASKYKVKMNDDIEGRGSSPISTIVKGDGNTEIEISSEVKVIVQPNNTTKSHKYVKIYPKIRKTLRTGDESKDLPIEVAINKNVKILESTITDSPLTTNTPTIEEVFTVEMPATTQATTAIPKTKQERIIKRRKRDAETIPQIEVDTDFIDKINHTLPPGPDKEAILRAKFPYYLDYKQIGLNENSALRYSEDLKKAPPKTKSKFAFYKQADQKRECSEVNPIVDPVPDRIKKQDEDPEAEEETDVAEQPETPRLGTLGDKIDCFKAKYFGENPFDNPLFEEKSVGAFEPIFEQIDKMSKKQPVVPVKREASQEKRKTKKVKGDVRNKKEAISDRIDSADNSRDWPSETVKDDNETKEDRAIDSKSSEETTESQDDPKKDVEDIDITKNEIDSDVKTTSTPTLITTPKYTIDLKPKHIYDQIELLDHLPADEENSPEKPSAEKSDDSPNEKKLAEAKSRIKEKKYNLEKIKLQNVDQADTSKPVKSKQKLNDDNSIFERYSLFDEDDAQTQAPISDENNANEAQNLEKLSEKGTETTLTFAPRSAKVKLAVTEKLNKLKKKIKRKLGADPTKARVKTIQKRRGRTFVSSKNLENVKDLENTKTTFETLPQAEPLRTHRRLRKRSRFPFIFDINPYLPHVPVINPPFVDVILTPRPASYLELSGLSDGSYEIFDINPYLSSTTEETGSESRISPKYKRLSEAFYKDDIKPDEQLNVFNDVINNIKNSPYQHDMSNAASEQVAVKVKPDDFKAKYKVKTTTNTPLKYGSRIKNHQQNADKKGFVRPNMKPRLRPRTTTTEPEWENYENHKNHKMAETETQVQENTKPVYETDQDVKKTEDNKTVTKETPTDSDLEDEEDDENSTEVIGLVPPKPHKYKTIYNPKRDINKDISSEENVEPKKLNRYLVPGMRPPPNRRVHSYSEYLTPNHIRQTPINHKRSKRSAARPAYAEVTRNRGGPQAEEKNETKTDDDDYEPHRPRNYHYDEESGRIIYDKTPEDIHEESEEVEYIEVIEETPSSTTGKPKQNPIFATATPPPEGESYVDFVKRLKSSSSYREIPDPVSTEKDEETSTTEPTSTAKPVSTTPPEFLSILAKVKNDSNYKTIEDKKKTTTTATTTEGDKLDDAEDVESQVQPIQNAPGSMGIVNGQMFKLFDITDFLPKAKNYMPKTVIDTSRYKSIQRPTSRHNLSSRYNSEEEKDLSNINTSKKPILAADERTGETKETPVEKAISPTLKTVRRGSPFITLTTVKPTQGSTTPRLNRGVRRRVTTVKTTTITQGDPSSPELTRNRRTHRRRNLRVRPVTTAATTTADSQAARTADALKVLHRRSQRDSTTLSSENKEQILPENRVNYRQARVQNEATTKPSEENNDNTVQVAQKVAHIFRNYNRLRRRGGPKEVDGVASENRLGQGQRNRISQSGDVDVFKTYDKTKKHGGNYRAENEGSAQVKDDESVEIMKDYDKTHKHGGNYKEENESGESKQAIVEENGNEKANDVETFKDYDKEKKHGGNYRSEEEAQHLSEPQYEESRVLTPKGNQIDTKVKDVEAFKNYDKTKKHGGNYVSEEEAKRIAAAKAKEQDIEIFNNYDKTKKHGGNYKSEEDGVLDPENEESSYDNLDADQKLKKRNHDNEDPEINFKPEEFYTDPKLPVVINGLKIVDDLSHEELEKIVSHPETSSEETSEGSDVERKDRQNVVVRDKETTTKKPFFIKDPSQRLYFYAPV